MDNLKLYDIRININKLGTMLPEKWVSCHNLIDDIEDALDELMNEEE